MLAETCSADARSFRFSEMQPHPLFPLAAPLGSARRIPEVAVVYVSPSSTESLLGSQEKLDVWTLGTESTLQPSGPTARFVETRASARFDRFYRLHVELSRMESLGENWDSYGSEPPNPGAIRSAVEALDELMKADILPNAVVPSAEGGVGIVFVRSPRYADVEFLNDGDILMSTYYADGPPIVQELASVMEVARVIREYVAA